MTYTVSSIDRHSHPEDGTTVWFSAGGETVGVNTNHTTGGAKFLDCDGCPIEGCNIGNWEVTDALLAMAAAEVAS